MEALLKKFKKSHSKNEIDRFNSLKLRYLFYKLDKTLETETLEKPMDAEKIKIMKKINKHLFKENFNH